MPVACAFATMPLATGARTAKTPAVLETALACRVPLLQARVACLALTACDSDNLAQATGCVTTLMAHAHATQAGLALAARRRTVVEYLCAMVLVCATTPSRHQHVRTAAAAGWVRDVSYLVQTDGKYPWTLAFASAIQAGPARAAMWNAQVTGRSQMVPACVTMPWATEEALARIQAAPAMELTAVGTARAIQRWPRAHACQVGNASAAICQTALANLIATIAVSAMPMLLVAQHARTVAKAGWAPVATFLV